MTIYSNCPSVTLIVNGEEIETKEVVDHAAVFENVPLHDGANTVTAKSGDVQANTITLNGVEEHNFAYDLPEGNEAANWFDDPAARAARKPLECPAGFYNIKCKIGDLLENSETAAVVKEAMGVVMGKGAFSMLDNKEFAAEDNPMQNFYLMMRLSDMLKMAGKGVTAEFKRELNDKLIKIKKN